MITHSEKWKKYLVGTRVIRYVSTSAPFQDTFKNIIPNPVLYYTPVHNYESTFKNCAFDLPHSYADNGNELVSFLKIYFHEKKHSNF